MLNIYAGLRVIIFITLLAIVYNGGSIQAQPDQLLQKPDNLPLEFTIKTFTTEEFFTSEDHAFEHPYRSGCIFTIVRNREPVGKARISSVNGSVTSFRLIEGRLNLAKRACYRLVFEKAPPEPRPLEPKHSEKSRVESGFSEEGNRLELPRLEISSTEYTVTGVNTVKSKITVINRSRYPVEGVITGCRFYTFRNTEFGRQVKKIDQLAPGESSTVVLTSVIPGNIQAILSSGSTLSVMLKGEQTGMRAEAFIQNAVVNSKDTWSWWPRNIAVSAIYCAGNTTIPTSRINSYSEIPAFEIATVNQPCKDWQWAPVNSVLGK